MKKRIQFDFDEREMRKLKALVENDKISAQSHPAVLLEAIRIYDWLLSLPSDAEIEIADKDGNVHARFPANLLQ